MRFIRLRSPADGTPDGASGPDNTSIALMDTWGAGEGVFTQGTPPATPPAQQAPPSRQVTPPVRPAQRVIQDNTDANGQTPTQQHQVQPDPQQVQVQPSAPASATLTEADLTRIATAAAVGARAGAPQQSTQQTVAEPPMTDEQFAARYRTPVVTDATMQALMDADPKKGAAAMNALLKQTYTAALLMSNDLHAAEIAKLRSEVSPHVRAFQTFQQERAGIAQRERFNRAHADIAAEGELVDEVRDSLEAKINRGELPRFTDEASAFKAVADNVRKLVARMGGAGSSPDGGQHPPAQSPPAPVQRRPAVLTQQGRGSSGQPQQKTAMDSVMDSWNQ